MNEEIVVPPRGMSLPFYVSMCGISYCDGTYMIQNPNSPVTRVEYIIRGQGTVNENNHCFRAIAGDIYILHQGRRHHYYSDEKDPWVKVWMNLSGPAVEHLISAYGLDHVNHLSGLNLQADFEEFINEMKESENGTAVSERGSLLFHRILQKISAHVRSAMGGKPSEIAVKMKEMIDCSVGCDIALEELSDVLFFSKAHLIRVFREEYGVTPYEYILERKLRIAKDLLIDTSLSVAEISSYLKFCDPHYFSNFFHSRVGITPRNFRKNAGIIVKEND